MERRALCAGLYWLLLPLALLAACLFRFNVLSLVYLLFLLLLPWFPGPTQRSAGGHTSRLLKALLGTSILFLLAHFVFQICLYTLPILDQLLGPSCSTWEVLARHIGVTRLDLRDIPNSVRLVAPDVGILLVSSLCLCLCRRLVPKAGAATRGRRPESLEPLERVRANPGAVGSIPPAKPLPASPGHGGPSPSSPQGGQPGTRGLAMGASPVAGDPGWGSFGRPAERAAVEGWVIITAPRTGRPG